MCYVLLLKEKKNLDWSLAHVVSLYLNQRLSLLGFYSFHYYHSFQRIPKHCENMHLKYSPLSPSLVQVCTSEHLSHISCMKTPSLHALYSFKTCSLLWSLNMYNTCLGLDFCHITITAQTPSVMPQTSEWDDICCFELVLLKKSILI